MLYCFKEHKKSTHPITVTSGLGCRTSKIFEIGYVLFVHPLISRTSSDFDHLRSLLYY